MEKLEELLPGIEKFLRTTLAKESLSKLAENQRLYYVERLDVIQLPPHLPPKPDGGEKIQMQGRKLPEPGKNKSSEDFIAHQRAISRQALPQTEIQSRVEDNPVPNDGLGIDSDQYDEGLYEEPVPMDSNFTDAHNYLPASGNSATFDIDSDADSSTSYESYDEPDFEQPYNNVDLDGQVKTDIPLPRLKTKRKKKPASILERYYKQLHSIVHEGELYHRTKGSWTKRYCALCDGIFYCYKDRDSKPLYGLALLGYDVLLQDKEKGRTNVLRLSHPGCETHFLSTDSASETQAWINKIEPLCYATSGDTTDDKSNDRTGSISSMETYMENSLLNGSPTMTIKNRKVTNTMSSDGKREKKGKLGKFFSETFGKKKGRAVAHQLEISEGSLVDRNSLSSPDITIAGVVKLSSPSLLSDGTWQYKHCAIRNGIFECFKDDSTSSDLDFSLLLTDYELSAEGNNSLSLAVTRQGETAFVMEPEDKIDQGDWLSALLKHVGNGGVHSATDKHDPEEEYTYVDTTDLFRGPSASLEEDSTEYSHKDGRLSEDERQYADLSDKEEGSSTGAVDVYDEPQPDSIDRLSKVYEEVSVTASKPNAPPTRQLSETATPKAKLDSESATNDDDGLYIVVEAVDEDAENNCRLNEAVLSDWLINSVTNHIYEVSKGGNPSDTGNLSKFSNSDGDDGKVEGDVETPTPHLSTNDGVYRVVSLEDLLGAFEEVYADCSVVKVTEPVVDNVTVLYDVPLPAIERLASDSTAEVIYDSPPTSRLVETTQTVPATSRLVETTQTVPAESDSSVQVDIDDNHPDKEDESDNEEYAYVEVFDSEWLGQPREEKPESLDKTCIDNASVVESISGTDERDGETNESDYVDIYAVSEPHVQCKRRESDRTDPTSDSLEKEDPVYDAVRVTCESPSHIKSVSKPPILRQRESSTKIGQLKSFYESELKRVAQTTVPTSQSLGSRAMTRPRGILYEPISESYASIQTQHDPGKIPMKKPASAPVITSLEGDKADDGRKTRVDMQTKADVVSSSPTPTDANKPSFSRESSCSSDGSSLKLSETIAKNRAMFENNCTQATNGTAKWTGFKLAGTANPAVKRTPSLSSTTSTKSTPNSAASSPRNSRASGTVDRFKAAFEANNNTITDRQLSPSPNTQRRAPADITRTTNSKTNRISPIKISSDNGEDSKPPPKFTAVFSSQATVQINSNKPRKLEIKSVTPSPFASGGGGSEDAQKLSIDPTLRFEIDLSSKDKCVTLGGDGRSKASSLNNTPKKSSTLPASSTVRTPLSNTSLSAACSRPVDRDLPSASSPNTTRASAKNFLSSTIQRLAAEDNKLGPASSNGATFTGSQEEEQKRLDQLRQKLTNLRKERQRVRDQKLSTVLPEDTEKLNAEYKRIDAEYKSTNQEKILLEDRQLQRIKDDSRDSIERRRSDAEKNSLIGKKKIWEVGS